MAKPERCPRCHKDILRPTKPAPDGRPAWRCGNCGYYETRGRGNDGE